ncbi:MAG: hypothetical protein AB7T01_08015 [Acidithiobacillus sp.]
MTDTSLSLRREAPQRLLSGQSAIPPNPVFQRLAEALSSAFSLPEPADLAELLGVEIGQDVASTLYPWIIRCLLDMDELQATQLLPRLVERLDHLLAGREAP